MSCICSITGIVVPVTCSNCCIIFVVPVAFDHASGYFAWLSVIALAKSVETGIAVFGVAVVVVIIFAGAVVVAGAVVLVVVTVLDAVGLDTETDELERDDLAAPAPPLELVLPLLELDVDALDEPELVDELDDPVLLELDRDAPAPAVLAVLPLATIDDPHFFYFLYC